MKLSFIILTGLGILLIGPLGHHVFDPSPVQPKPDIEIIHHPSLELKKAAFKILDTRCNVCHRRQNPFMLFKEKNMAKRAKKIYQMVFVEQRMPKGDDIKLTQDEYDTLEKWLKTQKIN